MKVTFRLNTARDGDLIKWLQALPGDPGMSYVIRQALRQHIHTGGTGFLFRDDVGQGQTQGQTAAVEAVQLPQGKASAAAKPEPEEVNEKKLEQALAGWTGA
ncbi:MAG TPA: hypothetical protein GX531_07665 [Methanothermobacter sp.]|nr:hypothetical protein [Methanothermobacter sp.]